ncbi:MAG: hypothetical protein F6K00_01475 [Leptolyngbya sp. SIOISBB]|nr:hypothetical protein [Leptolyngbya sp. SIOISBB]
MNRPRLTAKELRRRYCQGERDFAGVDLSGESLRGMILDGIDLSEANLNHADLRGTHFCKACLIAANLSHVQMGSRLCWTRSIQLFFISACVCFGFLMSPFADVILSKFGVIVTETLTERWSVLNLFGFGLLYSIPAFIFRYYFFRKINIIFGKKLCRIGFIFLTSSYLGGYFLVYSLSSESSFIVIFFIVIFLVLKKYLINSFPMPHEHPILPLIRETNIDYAPLKNILEYLSREREYERFLKGYRKFDTSFKGANLTKADFSFSDLMYSDFEYSDLSYARFLQVAKLGYAYLDGTKLVNPTVRDLLTSMNGKEQNFKGMDLQYLDLTCAHLNKADLTESDLSYSILAEANLGHANLTKAQALNSNFRRANLTGSCLESWNINHKTKLQDVICDYVYLLHNQQERRPNSGNFGPGEFTKLFQEVLDTVDLIFRNGVDWRAFLQTLNQVQQKYKDADLAIQSIENKGDGVVVAKLNAAPGADKPAIHESFTEIYQRAFKEAEAQYKAQLNAKDSEIQIYRQQSADMVEILKLQAQRPIINQATAESRAMQGNDYSQQNQYGDNSNIVNQYGDSNTANQKLQQVTPPPPETVNIQAELLALHDLLAALNDPVTDGIAQKLDAEAQKPEPSKDVIGQTLEAGLTYAKNLQGFAEAIDQLRPHVQNAAGWLGKNWYKLLTLVGLAAL